MSTESDRRSELHEMTKSELVDFIRDLEAQVEQLQRQVAEISKPMTSDEYFNACFVDGGNAAVDVFNRVLASRARTK